MNIRFIKGKDKKIRNRRGIEKADRKNENKFIIIIVLCVVFLFGVLFGTLYLINDMEENSFKIEDNLLDSERIIEFEKDKKEIFVSSICQNLIILIFFWIIGLSVVGFPILIFYILFEGASIGITISYILLNFGFYKGYGFICISMYLTVLLNVFSMLILCYSAIKVTINVFQKSKDIKSEFLRHSTVCILSTIILFFSSIIEVYMGEIGKNFILN